MLTQYKNKNNLTTGADYLARFDESVDVNGLLVKNIDIINYTEPSVELHVYSNDTWITGEHKVSIFSQYLGTLTPAEYIALAAAGKVIPDRFLRFNLKNEFNRLKLSAGRFRIVVNFFKDIIGSYDEQYLYVDEISPDRTEVKLRQINNLIPSGIKQFVDYEKIFTPNQKDGFIPPTDVNTFPNFNQYLLNFSRNKTFAYVNTVVVGDSIYIKLLDALPDNININDKCWIVQEIKLPYTDIISLTVAGKVKTFKSLTTPNWEVKIGNTNISSGTEIKNWNDLLGNGLQTSQQIVDKYFSGSLEGIPLNIDYRDFNNFIFYSSAEERLHNFKYKLELSEYYDKQIAMLSAVPGKTSITKTAEYNSLKTNLVSGFDSFEKYLYYESSSLLFNNDVPVINPTVSSLTGSYIFPTPKSGSIGSLKSYSVTSSIFNSWYDTLISSASLYDSLNINKLTNFLPPAIQYNENNDQLVTFVNMLGHHYDILHAYIKQASNIYKHEENPKIGMPDDLLFSVAKQFGWDLADGNQYQDLWEYVLGTNETGGLLSGSNTVGDISVAGSKMTKTVWRRIVNNLPFLLKSKGTKRSIKALLSCYGIPESLISINEYGGPSSNKVPVYEKLNFDYSLDLINNASGTVNINYSQPIGGVELRFRLDDVVTNPTMPSTMNLITISGSQINVKLNFTRGTLGTATIYDHLGTTATTNEIELFDGKWLSMLINKNGSNLDLFINKAKYGKVVATVSASIASALPTKGSVKLGVPATAASRLYGQLQELRLWTGSLSLSAFANHTKAPSAYNGTTDAYSELVFRLPLTQKINHATTSSLLGVQPVSNNISASFTGWSNDIPYDSIEETYYFDSVSLPTGTHEDNKIQIATSNINSANLQLLSSIDRDEVDEAAIGSNKLGVYFSPQTMINEDIIAQLGYTELDSYIGDPGQYEENSYPDLERRAQDYWKKYTNRSNLNEYIKIFTLFDLSFFKQLEQLLPARVNKLTGLLIQPNLLERNKQSIPLRVHVDNQQLSSAITITDNIKTVKADYLLVTSSIGLTNLINSDVINNDLIASISYVNSITSAIDTDLNMYLTGSNASRYNGFNYRSDDGVIAMISDGVVNEFVTKIQTIVQNGITYIISSSSTTSAYKPTGYANAVYNGTKMTSAGININSPDTYQKKPVVEIRDVNGNIININPGTLSALTINVKGGSNPGTLTTDPNASGGGPGDPNAMSS